MAIGQTLHQEEGEAMAEQVRVEKPSSSRREEPAPAPASANPAMVKGKQLKEDIDKLVDEIDDVLDENMKHEALKHFVQRGGE